MGETKNLIHRQAIKKIQELAKDVDITMFCTKLTQQPFDVCPMSTQRVEDDGTIWFFSGKDSDHNKDVQSDPAVQLIYSSKVGESDHLSLYGKAEVTYDKQKAEELFTPHVKVWFPKGPTDPNLTLIRFTPESGYYWDTKNGKMVSLAKYAASIVTGKTMDDGIKGELKI